MTPPESTASPAPFVDRAEVDRTAELYAEHGVEALYQAQEQIFKADAEHRPNDLGLLASRRPGPRRPGISNSLLRF